MTPTERAVLAFACGDITVTDLAEALDVPIHSAKASSHRTRDGLWSVVLTVKLDVPIDYVTCSATFTI